MSYQIKYDANNDGVPDTTLTLPIPPTSIRVEHTADIREKSLPASRPYILSFGIKSVRMIWEGILAEPGKDLAYIHTTYIVPLLNSVHEIVTVITPNGRYNGDWVLLNLVYEERGGEVLSYRYRIEFALPAMSTVLYPPG